MVYAVEDREPKNHFFQQYITAQANKGVLVPTSVNWGLQAIN